MKSYLIKNLSLLFPNVANKVVECREIDVDELFVKLNDGSKYIYNDMEETIRPLPQNSNELTEEECKKEFGIRLRKRMRKNGWTQTEFANIVGLTQGQVSSYITGKTTPSFYIADKIAKALECSLDDLRYID